eukprot:Em0019g60a
MDYHIEQVAMCCRVCGQKLWKSKAKQKISYECNAFTADLKIAFDIDTSGDDVVSQARRTSTYRTMTWTRVVRLVTSAYSKMLGLHHKCTVSVFQWQKNTDSQCKAKSRKHLPGPNTLIARLQKIASPPALLHEPSPPLASVNYLPILEELKCAICANVLSQPPELMCSSLVCTKCLTECIAASGAEERQAAELLKRAISTSPDKGVVQLATGGAPMSFMQVTKAQQQTTATCSRTRCSEMQRIQSIVSGGEASALIQKEVLTLSDEERQCLLATASISSSIEIGLQVEMKSKELR